MKISTLINTHLSEGHTKQQSESLAGQEIFLQLIANSSFAEKITLKGGIVMYNLTKNERRATQDIDFDFIGYAISNQSISKFINELSKSSSFDIKISGDIKELNQEDYLGKRVNLLISDDTASIKLKLDIGVHTHLSIIQNPLLINFSISNNAYINTNPPSQIVAEKILSLYKHGTNSTRFKDVYDIYFLIKENLANKIETNKLITKFLNKDLSIITKSIKNTLSNNEFKYNCLHSKSAWLICNYDDIVETIVNFLKL